MARRERLIAAMNPRGKTAWSDDSQELNLLLHELEQHPPEGWQVRYELADDAPRPDGLDNRELFAEEQRAHWQRAFLDRRDRHGDTDAGDDLAAMQSSGQHVLLELVHEATNAHAYRWVDRESLMLMVRLKNRTSAQKLAALRVHVDAAVADGAARVTRKQQRLAEAGTRRPQ